MKTITVNVSEPIYEDFQSFAEKSDRTTSELIREAMADYHRRRIKPQTSLHEVQPVRLGKLRRPLDLSDLGDEMMG